jgi:hypothetical protein
MKSLSTVALKAGNVFRMIANYLVVVLQAVDDNQLTKAVGLGGTGATLIDYKPKAGSFSAS